MIYTPFSYNRLEAFTFCSHSAALPCARDGHIAAAGSSTERTFERRRVAATLTENFFRFPRTQPRNTLPQIRSFLKGIR